MFEWPHNSLEHVSVHLNIFARNLQLHALAKFSCSLARHMAEPGRLRGNPDHACAHKAFLQTGVDTCLLYKCGLRLACKGVEARLNSC